MGDGKVMDNDSQLQVGQYLTIYIRYIVAHIHACLYAQLKAQYGGAEYTLSIDTQTEGEWWEWAQLEGITDCRRQMHVYQENSISPPHCPAFVMSYHIVTPLLLASISSAHNVLACRSKRGVRYLPGAMHRWQCGRQRKHDASSSAQGAPSGRVWVVVAVRARGLACALECGGGWTQRCLPLPLRDARTSCRPLTQCPDVRVPITCAKIRNQIHYVSGVFESWVFNVHSEDILI